MTVYEKTKHVLNSLEKGGFHTVTRWKRARQFLCDHARKCRETTPHRGVSNAQVWVEASKTLPSSSGWKKL